MYSMSMVNIKYIQQINLPVCLTWRGYKEGEETKKNVDVMQLVPPTVLVVELMLQC